MFRTHAAGKGPGWWGQGLGLAWPNGAPECLQPQSVKDQARDLSRLPGIWVGSRNASHVPLQSSELLRVSPCWFPHSEWASPGMESLPFPSCPSGAWVPSHLHFSFPLAPPHVLPGLSGVPSVPLGVEVTHHRLVVALVVRRCKLHVLLLRHLDSAPTSIFPLSNFKF